jgi:hypothetical protein
MYERENGGGADAEMVIRYILLFLIIAHVEAVRAEPNSCANVATFGSWDQSGLRESSSAIWAVGTFRIFEEQDESKQPLFNLAQISCERQVDDMGDRQGLNVRLSSPPFGQIQAIQTPQIQTVYWIWMFPRIL